MSKQLKILAIDAFNVKSGGAVEHLNSFLSQMITSFPEIKVFIFTNQNTKKSLPQTHHNFIYKTNKIIESNFFFYLIFQIFIYFPLQRLKAQALFVPGGVSINYYKNKILMSQNMLPFQREESKRFIVLYRFKFLLLKKMQVFSFNTSKGVIFLSNFAKDFILSHTRIKSYKVIPHGVNQQPFSQRHPLSEIQILYVSPFLPYKHQDILIEAFKKLKNDQFNIKLVLAGGGFKSQILNAKKLAKNTSDIVFTSELSADRIHDLYKKSDIFVFPSTCENLPITLLEAMNSSLPILASNTILNKEILGSNRNIYFDINDKITLHNLLKSFISNPDLRKEEARYNYGLSKKFLWKENTVNTIKYIETLI